MPDADIQRFEMELAIRFTLIRQRRAWIFRDLTSKRPPDAARAREALIQEVMEVVSGFDVEKIEREFKLHSTP